MREKWSKCIPNPTSAFIFWGKLIGMRCRIARKRGLMQRTHSNHTKSISILPFTVALIAMQGLRAESPQAVDELEEASVSQ